MQTVHFTIPNASRRLILEGSPGEEIHEYVRAAELRRHGRGHQATITMPVDLARNLSDYLWGVEGVVNEMTGAEREGGREAEIAYRARAPIDFALAALEVASPRFRVNFKEPARPDRIIRAANLREAQDIAYERWPVWQVAGVSSLRD